MESESLKQEIDALIADLGEDATIAKPAAERRVLEQIRLLLDGTRDERTRSARGLWEIYLPYAAKRCNQLIRLEEGWEDDQEYFVSENVQFWLDCANAQLEAGDISGVQHALAQISEACRMVRRDRIFQVDILLQALEVALEISDKKRSIQLYEEAEKVYRKHLAGGSEFTGSAWLRKIKKMGQALAHHREKLARYFQYVESITVSIEADSENDLERVINYLQQSLVGKVKVTRRAKAASESDSAADKPGGRARARIKITLD